ncbi:S41 family peptidase [Flavobacterium hydrophilum]|uniref:Tail specific protease domain-containing protein n=1 Tax=Flavobacterium hydrophilum TaxID=2211445 RepID=A0A2V4C3A1_9FLAO|nr:S41 family peptidase [Flavobacterium hydrophilum]PXY44380.1 hypothetical protein DMB68_13000 [Flavobacterium hydrophilum]
MKKINCFLIVCIFNLFSFAQVHPGQTNDKRIENLASLSKVWGFLKYYHPNVAKGNYNWDEQLLNLIPQIEKAEGKEALSKIYLQWIAGLGDLKQCKSCKIDLKEKYFDNNLNLSWIDDANTFTAELSQKLRYIESNRFQGKNFYVTKTSVDNIQITNEPKYTDFEFPERNLRLLSLFRYWNIVEYFFPYKYQTDQNWNAVLLEMIPKFLNAESATAYHLVMLETVIKLDDTHANFYTNHIGNFFGTKSLPIFFNLVENQITITGFPYRAGTEWDGLKTGDIIEEIDNNNVLKTLSERKKYIHGSNQNAKARNYDYLVLSSSTDSVNLKLSRNDQVFYKKVKLLEGNKFIGKINVNTKKYYIDENNIGYIDLALLEIKDQDEMMQKLNSAKAIMIDVRNPNLAPFRIASRLITKDKEYAKIVKPDLSYPGKFIWEKPLINTPIKNEFYAGKVVLIVNQQTQSSSEFRTMLLQSGDNVTTVGNQTAGADGDVSKAEFIGYKPVMSGLGVFYPDGTPTQRTGVKVDIAVYPTIKGIQEGKDELMEAAKNICWKTKS